MHKNKILKNAESRHVDLSIWHEPDSKWSNYYIEDEKNNILYLLPTFLFMGPVILDLDWARNATVQTPDGVIHQLKDHSVSMSSSKRRISYPKIVVNDRSAKCGMKTVLINTWVAGHPFQQYEEDLTTKMAADHLNGWRLDNRHINIHWGTVKENNDNRYPYKNVSLPKFPFEQWW